jgi:hypothetical protein
MDFKIVNIDNNLNMKQKSILEDLVYYVYLSKIADFQKDNYLKNDLKFRFEYKINEAKKEDILYKQYKSVLDHANSLDRRYFIDNYFKNIVEAALHKI